MSGSVVLTLIAVVLSVGDGSVTVGGEALALLEPGDRGEIYYELTVGPEARRIDVGTAVVIAVESQQAGLAMSSGADRVQTGYSVEFTVPYERAQSSLGAALERIDGLESELTAWRDQASSAESELQATQKRLEVQETQLAAAHREAAAAGTGAAAAEADLRRRLEELQRTADEMAAERDAQSQRLRAVAADKEELRQEIAAAGARQQETTTALEQARAELAGAQEHLGVLETELAGARQALDAAAMDGTATVAELRRRIGDLQLAADAVAGERDELATRLQVVSREKDDAIRQAAEAGTEAAGRSADLDRTRGKLDVAQGRIGDLENELTAAQERAGSLEAELTETRVRLGVLDSDLAAARQSSTAVVNDAAAAEEGLLQRLAELERRNAELAREVEALVFVLGQTIAESGS